jgi:lipoprotein-anchoring transpeptidase ErfK/SrfK
MGGLYKKVLTVILVTGIVTGIYLFLKIYKNTLFALPANTNIPQNNVVDVPSEPVPISQPVIPEPETIEYYLYTVSETTPLLQLKKDLGPEKFAIVLALNHVDAKFVGKDSKLIVPTKFPDNIQNFLLDYSPFPKKNDLLINVPKIILISQKFQYLAVYQNGILVYSAPVSTGKKSTQTPNGLFTANWKAKKSTSTVDSSWILPWVVNLDNFDGISMHQYELPGYPASHSCIRMREIDAMWVYDFVDQWILSDDGKDVAVHGTPVIIFDNYEYGKLRPWFNLVEDPTYLNINEEYMNNVLQPFVDKVLDYSNKMVN